MKSKVLGLPVFMFLLSVGTAFAASGVAHIKGTTEGSGVSGEVLLTDTPEGLKITLSLENVPAGKHGFHIHENAACSDEGKAAGGHYNPEGVPHGLIFKDGFEHAHAGDFGNIEIGADGSGHFEAIAEGLALTGGQYNVAGRSFILHEKEDDFGQPTGNAGGRIACGTIEVAS